MRKYYGEDGTVTHHQILIPKHIVPELLSTLHGKMNKHPGITKMTHESRIKYCYPGLARKIRAWVINSPDCIANKRIDTRQTRPKNLSNTEFTFGPDDCLENDILPNLPSSIDYKHNITWMDVFSRYLFAYPTQDMTARTVGRCIVDVMTRHCYLQTVILTDKESQFRSDVLNQIAQTLDIPISHASTKTRPNSRDTRKNSSIIENVPKNVDGRTTLNVAQKCANCCYELQHKLPRKPRLRTDNSNSRTTSWTSNWDSSQNRKKTTTKI